MDEQHSQADQQLWQRAAGSGCALSVACPDQLELASYLDGQLSDPQIESFEAHLADCRECRQAVADARLIAAQAAVSTSAAPQRVIESAQALVRQRVQPSARLNWRITRWSVAVAASIAICVWGYRAGMAYTASTDILPERLAWEMSFGVFDSSDDDSDEIELFASLLSERLR